MFTDKTSYLHLDNKLHIHKASLSAIEILRSSHPISIKHKQLAITYRRLQQRIVDIIQLVTQVQKDSIIENIMVTRMDGHRPLLLSAQALDKSKLALVYINDLDRLQAQHLDELSIQLQLKPTEAEFLRVYYETLSLKKTAQELNISVDSSRCKLKRLCKKASCHNQLELIDKIGLNEKQHEAQYAS